MNVNNLRENYPLLISHMENAAYSPGYIRAFRREINNILRLADSGKALSYADVYCEHEKSGASAQTLFEKRVIIGAIECFDLNGLYPDGTIKRHVKGAYHSLCAEYKKIIDCFIHTATKHGKQQSSIKVQAQNASAFFLELQRLGVESLERVTEADVFNVFFTPDGRLIRRYTNKNLIANVLKTCIPAYPACEKVLTFLPALRNKRKNIKYLTPDEIINIKEVLSSEVPGLSLRDKAIGMLALYTGLRSSDIAGLKMDAIDWDSDLLTITQQKTRVPLELTLTAIVGNAVHDYIETERPKSDCDCVFISQSRPFGPIQGKTMYEVSAKIMKMAGVRQTPGDRKGFHLFRHHLVTQLLGNGVSRPVISSIVGHTLPASLDIYLRADFPHLKECSISVENFPVNKGVFAI